MHNIVRQLWDRDLNLKKWSAINGFNYNTTQAVVHGRRGQWVAGKAKKIREALINQGFATVDDFNIGENKNA